MKINFAIFLILFIVSEFAISKKLEYTFESQGGKNFLVIKSPSKNKKKSNSLSKREKRKLEIKQKKEKENTKKRKLLDFKKLLVPVL